MKNPSPEQLMNTRPAALRDVFASMPATIAPYMRDLSEVVGHYITAVYFTDCGDGDQPPHDADMAPVAVLVAVKDCAAFMSTCAQTGLLAAYKAAGGTLAQFGHDYWLTRNRHGAGFWDRQALDVPFTLDPRFGATHAKSLGDVLSEFAHQTGPRDTYAGDDGLIYFM